MSSCVAFKLRWVLTSTRRSLLQLSAVSMVIKSSAVSAWVHTRHTADLREAQANMAASTPASRAAQPSRVPSLTRVCLHVLPHKAQLASSSYV